MSGNGKKLPYLVELYGQEGVRQFIAECLAEYDRLAREIQKRIDDKKDPLKPRQWLICIKTLSTINGQRADLVLRNELISPAPKLKGEDDGRSVLNFYIGDSVPLEHPLLAGNDIRAVGDAGHSDGLNDGAASKG